VIDANAAIQQASTGMAPPSWQVLRARPSFFVWSAIGGIAFTLGAIAAVIYLRVSHMIVGMGLTDQTPTSVLAFWQVADLVVLAVCVVLGIVGAVRHLRRLGSAADQMLILMPEGFVMRRGTGSKDVTTVNFARVASMTPSAQRGGIALAMRIAGSGKPAQVTFDNRFGPAKRLTQEIAGMHAHYLTTAAAGVQAPQ
jgi:hypothetical protein